MPIYLVTNTLNNRYYVGKTVRKVSDRWACHVATAKKKDKQYLHKAIKKYGQEVFDVQTISKETDDAKLRNLEKVWIILLQSRSDAYGYNLTSGGDGITGYRYSEEQRKEMSQRYKARHLERPEIIEKAAAANRGRPAWNKGKSYNKTHCPSGHALTDDNILRRPNCNHRVCKTCHMEKGKERSRIKSGYYERRGIIRAN